MQYTGLIIGVCTFLIIGLFHPVVVKAEYYWGARCWWLFLLLGSFWTIKELFEQEERVKKGWFPKNPRRKYKF